MIIELLKNGVLQLTNGIRTPPVRRHIPGTLCAIYLKKYFFWVFT